jgi:tetratricopeptide (TPR) repeat protein
LQRPDLALNHFALAEADHRALLGDEALLKTLEQDAAPGDVSARAAFTHQLAATHAGRALAYGRLDDLPAMCKEAEAALALRRENLGREPNNLAWRDGLMADSNTLALALLRLGDNEAALQAAQTSWDTARRLAQDEGPNSKWAGIQPTLAPQYGRALAAVGRYQDALDVFDIAFAPWSADLAQHNDVALRLRLTQLQVWRARALQGLGDMPAAVPLLSTAVVALRGLAGPGASPSGALHRDALLALAEGLASLAQWTPAEAPALRSEAIAALKEAAAVQRLGADQERLLAALASAG